MLNLCVLSGNLGADPEIRYAQNGDPISTFSLAFRSGKDKTSWIKAVAFKRLAEVCHEHLRKGSRVVITGMLEQERWQTNNGETKTGYKVIAHSVEFIGKPSSNNEDSSMSDEDLPF